MKSRGGVPLKDDLLILNRGWFPPRCLVQEEKKVEEEPVASWNWEGWKPQQKTLPLRRESFTWIILKAICLFALGLPGYGHEDYFWISMSLVPDFFATYAFSWNLLPNGIFQKEACWLHMSSAWRPLRWDSWVRKVAPCTWVVFMYKNAPPIWHLICRLM